MTVPFTYPAAPHQRRHGPQGYVDYASYRPWLRDEFSFRCVYCLLREQWGYVRGNFDVDHFQPVALFPEQTASYDNLVYSCSTCNGAKGDSLVPDPCQVLLHKDIRVQPDGSIEADTVDARRLIRILGLDDPESTEFRLLWIGLAELAERHAPALLQKLMGFPDNLPDLGRLLPPGGNSRPEGLDGSCYRQRERGTLPPTY